MLIDFTSNILETNVAVRLGFFASQTIPVWPIWNGIVRDATHLYVIGQDMTCVLKFLNYIDEMSMLIRKNTAFYWFTRKITIHFRQMSLFRRMKFMENWCILLASYNYEHIGGLAKYSVRYEQLS